MIRLKIFFVRTEGTESKRHTAHVMYHGPMTHSQASMYKEAVEYVDDPTITASVVHSNDVPKDACIRGVPWE